MDMYQGPGPDGCFVDAYGRAMRADLVRCAKAFPSLSGQWLGGFVDCFQYWTGH